jgi:hypothetical protein
MATVKDKIKGAFDLTFLFGKGIKPFETEGTKAHAIKSMIIPAALYPLGVVTAWFYPPQGMHDGTYPFSQIMVTLTAAYLFGFVATLGLGWVFAYALKQQERFWLFVQASNWTSIAFTLVTIPVLLMMIFNIMPREEMDRIAVIITCYGFIITGCVAYKSFRVPWELAGALACMTLFINQQVWNALFYMQDIDLVW